VSTVTRADGTQHERDEFTPGGLRNQYTQAKQGEDEDEGDLYSSLRKAGASEETLQALRADLTSARTSLRASLAGRTSAAAWKLLNRRMTRC
jgi:hypothetical protein